VTESGQRPTQQLPADLAKERQESTKLNSKDHELNRLVTLDEEIDGLLGEGVNFNERDDEIVGLQREKEENMSEGATRGKQMTVKDKIEKELAYVTEAMGLDQY